MPTAQDTIMFQGTAIGIFSHQETAVVAFDATNKKITRAAGSFIATSPPAAVGMFVNFENAGATNKKKCAQIVAVSALELTLDIAPADLAAASVTLRYFSPAALITGFQGPGSTNPRVDVSHSLSTSREYKPGLQDNGSFSFDGNCVRGDAGFIALKVLRDARANADFLIADGDRLGFQRFNGGVETIERRGQLDGAITFNAQLFVSGALVDSELI